MGDGMIPIKYGVILKIIFKWPIIFQIVIFVHLFTHCWSRCAPVLGEHNNATLPVDKLSKLDLDPYRGKQI